MCTVKDHVSPSFSFFLLLKYQGKNVSMKRKRTRGETKSYTVVPYVPSFIILSFFLLLQLYECIACSFLFFLVSFPPSKTDVCKTDNNNDGGEKDPCRLHDKRDRERE